MIDVLSDGSLAYLADGVTLVSQNGNFVSPPVANSGSIDDSFVEKNEISIALSPYFFSRFNFFVCLTLFFFFFSSMFTVSFGP